MMQVSWKRQFFLAIALVALGTFAYWLEFKHKPMTEEKEAKTKKLFDVKDAQVESIRISTGANKSFVMSCQDLSAKQCKPGDPSKWDLLEPVKLRGDDSNINSLATALSNTEATGDPIDLKDETPEKRAALLKDYGLDPESRKTGRKIDVKTSAGESIVYFGGTHPIGDGIFAVQENVPPGGQPKGQIDDTRVLLVPSYFKSNFEHELTYWRDKKILNLPSHDVASFKLDSVKSGKLTGHRVNGEWTIQGDPRAHASGDYAGDNEGIDTYLNGLSFLAAKEFASESHDDEKAKELLKGTKPVLTLTVQQDTPKPAPAPSGKPAEPQASAPEPIVITFLQKPGAEAKAPKPKKGEKPKTPPAPASKLYVTVTGKEPLYEVDSYAKDRFEKALKDLRMSKLMTSMERFTTRKMDFSGDPLGAPALVLTSKDGKWIQEPADKAEVDSTKVQNLLDKLTGSKIHDFLEGSAFPSGEDKGLALSLTDDKGKIQRQFVFWKAPSRLYARDMNSPRKEAFQLDSGLGDALPWTRTFFDKSATPPAPAKPQAAAPQVHTGMPPGMLGHPGPGMMLPHGHPQLPMPTGGPPTGSPGGH